MKDATSRLTGSTYLKHIADRLTRAAGVARAAESCARAGDDEGAARMIADIDMPVYEAQTLISAAHLLNRIDRDLRTAETNGRGRRTRKRQKG